MEAFDTCALTMLTADTVRIGLDRGRLPVRNAGYLDVRYSSEIAGDPDARVVEVRLALHEDPLTPTNLQRFAWARWLNVADSYWRTHDRDDIDPQPHNQVLIRALNAERRIPNTGRPGRRGHPPEHYRKVAERYGAFRAAGASNPTARLAAERHVSRHTAAGWVSEARKRGFLPPARRGKPG